MNKIINGNKVYLLLDEVIENAIILEDITEEEIREDLQEYIVKLEGFGDLEFIEEVENTYFITATKFKCLEDIIGEKIDKNTRVLEIFASLHKEENIEEFIEKERRKIIKESFEEGRKEFEKLI